MTRTNNPEEINIDEDENTDDEEKIEGLYIHIVSVFQLHLYQCQNFANDKMKQITIQDLSE